MDNIMEYELINPSDPYTFLAESFEVAVLTVFCISTAYGAKSKNGEKEIPLFIFGGSEAWFLGEFHKTVEESLNENKRAVADALDSFMYGGFNDRERYNLALELITDDDKREEFREKWQDSRSSINDIGTYAHQIAKKIKEQLKLSEKEG